MSRPLGLLAAFNSERDALMGRARKSRKISRLRTADGIEVVCLCSGAGPERALAAARELAALDPAAMISAGLSAGLAPHLTLGAVVLADRVIEDPRREEGIRFASPELLEIAGDRLNDHGLAPVVGPAAVAREPVTRAGDKAAIHGWTQGLCLDMESFSVARAAAEASIPFLCLRVVLDDASRALAPELAHSMDAQGQPSAAKAIKAIITKPRLIPEAIRLGRDYATALSVLGKAFRALLDGGLPCGGGASGGPPGA